MFSFRWWQCHQSEEYSGWWYLALRAKRYEVHGALPGEHSPACRGRDYPLWWIVATSTLDQQVELLGEAIALQFMRQKKVTVDLLPLAREVPKHETARFCAVPARYLDHAVFAQGIASIGPRTIKSNGAKLSDKRRATRRDGTPVDDDSVYRITNGQYSKEHFEYPKKPPEKRYRPGNLWNPPKD